MAGFMIRVFPRQTNWIPTDELAFVGDPPLFRPPQQPVRISVIFTWDIPEGERLSRAWGAYYKDVEVSGPAFNAPANEFIPGRFIKQGVTITSRGCNRRCPWCYVPKREGKIREIRIRPGWIIEDNNLLACSREHIERVFDMFREQKRAIYFNGGLDSRLLKKWHKELLDSIKIGEVWFACDSLPRLNPLEKVAEMLEGIPIKKKRCYVLIGFNGESLTQAEQRLEKVYSLDFLPFAQLYQNQSKKKYPKDWRDLARKWSRPALYRR